MGEALVSISSTEKNESLSRGEGDGSVSKVSALQTKGPEFNSRIRQKKEQGMVVHIPSPGDAKTDGSLGCTGGTD